MIKDKKINWLIFILTFCVCLVVSECILRIDGYMPGVFINKREFEGIPVCFTEKKIELVPFFKSDSNGILRIVPDSLDPTYLKKYTNLLFYHSFFQTKINKDGFRGNEFEPDSLCKKILLIGDSYTWGYSAKPIDSCFADLLQSYLHDYKIYNAALPGLDVVSYKRNIEILLPKLKPNIVILNFYAGNDFIKYDKKLIPYENNVYFY